MTTVLQGRNHLVLTGDVPLRSLDIAFSFFEALLQDGAIHQAAYQQTAPLLPLFCP